MCVRTDGARELLPKVFYHSSLLDSTLTRTYSDSRWRSRVAAHCPGRRLMFQRPTETSGFKYPGLLYTEPAVGNPECWIGSILGRHEGTVLYCGAENANSNTYAADGSHRPTSKSAFPNHASISCEPHELHYDKWIWPQRFLFPDHIPCRTPLFSSFDLS